MDRFALKESVSPAISDLGTLSSVLKISYRGSLSLADWLPKSALLKFHYGKVARLIGPYLHDFKGFAAVTSLGTHLIFSQHRKVL